MNSAISRRGILAGAAAATALSGCTVLQDKFGGGGARAATMDARTGIQLYTVRAAMQADVPGSLKKIADIGYRQVEFAGYFGHSPAEIRKMVADLGMTAPSSHIQVADARTDAQACVDRTREAGHKFLVLAWFPPEQRQTLDQWKEIAGFCNHVAGLCKTAGLSFAYHNHNFEFEAMNGVLPYDVMIQNTDPSLVQFELDLYWAKKAGQDLDALLARHQGRIVMCHVKDMAPDGSMADVGQGTIDFARMLAAPAAAPMEYYFVENDDTKTPFESAAISCSALSNILKSLPRR